MEDAHAAVLDLQTQQEGKTQQAATSDKRLAFFGVYDGHGGEKVAQFAGEKIHQIVASQEAFSKGDMEQALKDGFLATDRAILNGMTAENMCDDNAYDSRHSVRGRGIRLHCDCGSGLKRENMGGTLSLREQRRKLISTGQCWRFKNSSRR